jgi:hypothetical protein
VPQRKPHSLRMEQACHNVNLTVFGWCRRATTRTLISTSFNRLPTTMFYSCLLAHCLHLIQMTHKRKPVTAVFLEHESRSIKAVQSGCNASTNSAKVTRWAPHTTSPPQVGTVGARVGTRGIHDGQSGTGAQRDVHDSLDNSP